MGQSVRKRDSSAVHAVHNPDGSWFEIPDDPPVAASAPVPSGTSSPAGSVRQFLREIASRGGKSRAARHSRAELAAWGRVRHKSNPTR
jgi:hypothetical protein